MEVVTSRTRRTMDREISPERRKVWTEPNKQKPTERKVPVVYYLSRNGHFEHPHFMEVSVPSNQGLYLRDVINRLDALRGKGMASMYAWSSKRSYKNGFVWHDLTEDDFIYPVHSNEYVLKGSEILHLDSLQETHLEAPKPANEDSEISILNKTKPARSSFDLSEYKVYRNQLKNMDACTQTEDQQLDAIKEEQVEEVIEISPPSSTSSSSSSGTLEALIKSDGQIVPIVKENEKGGNIGGNVSRRKISRTQSALLQLLSCGAVSVVSQFRGRMPNRMLREEERGSESESVRVVELEEKEYFSGSLLEIKKKESAALGGDFSGLRRSSSCNAERGGLKMELKEEEIDGFRARCLFRKPKLGRSTMVKKEETTEDSSTNENRSVIDESIEK